MKMMCSPLGRMIGKVTWLITALAAIHLGALVYGYDFFLSPLMQNNLHTLIVPIHYLFGLAGIVSLVWWVSSVFLGCGSKDYCGCK
ncbi:MAG: hypothetical protein WBQ73_02490 [Candidatus Babeliales bacterium]